MSKPYNQITLQNQQYAIREIELPKFGKVLISTVALNDSLMNDTGGYVSDEARAIDEKIFHFVEQEELELPDDDLIRLLIEQVQ